MVVGMARSGMAAAQFLKSLGAVVTVSDHRPASDLNDEILRLKAQGIAWETGGHTEALFEKAESIVVSPGVPLRLPLLQKAKARGKEVISEIELAFRHIRGKILAITGTNGKTTTTTLTGELLRQADRHVQVGGNIGTALISLVTTSTPTTWNVVEMSSFQLEAIPTFRPDIAVVLNITPDHLDRYASFEAYVQAKLNIFSHQTRSDFAVLNQEDASLCAVAGSLTAPVFWFSAAREVPCGTFFDGANLVWKNAAHAERIIPRSEVALRGSHNVENVAAAITAARLAGVEGAVIARGVKAFRPVEHRLEPVAEIRGVLFYNDSKATNVDATIKALEAFESGLIVILGGRDKGGDFTPLAALIRSRVKRIVLLGEASGKIENQLAGSALMDRAHSMEHAVKLAFEQSEKGDTVLLAPACASFDMFLNYEHRGREFKKAVRKLQDSVL